MRILSFLLVSGAVSILGLSGCGSNPNAGQPKAVPVSGTVKVDGAPAPDVGVMFFPAGSTRGNKTYYGNTDPKGHYELSAGADKGAPAGEYKVTCSKYVKADGSPFKSDGTQSPEMAGAKEAFAPRYSDPSQTELKATVKDSGATLDFELKSK